MKGTRQPGIWKVPKIFWHLLVSLFLQYDGAGGRRAIPRSVPKPLDTHWSGLSFVHLLYFLVLHIAPDLKTVSLILEDWVDNLGRKLFLHGIDDSLVFSNHVFSSRQRDLAYMQPQLETLTEALMCKLGHADMIMPSWMPSWLTLVSSPSRGSSWYHMTQGSQVNKDALIR